MRGLMQFAMSVLTGCSSFGRTVESDDESSIPEATVEVRELEIESSLHEGCVETIEELPTSYVYKKDNPYLHSDALIVVLKEARRLMLLRDGKIRHDRASGAASCWKVALGTYSDGRSSGTFDKIAEGDRHTPIGFFRTSDKPWSTYYGAILIHYPSTRHAQQGLIAKRITKATVDKIARAELAGSTPPQDTLLGGDILIHGGGSSYDWTWGCIAMDNHDIDELRGLLPKGMKTWILILP